MVTVPPARRAPHLSTPEGEAHAFRVLVAELERHHLPRPQSAVPVGALNVMDVRLADVDDLRRWARALDLAVVGGRRTVEARVVLDGHAYELWATR
jgi:hypothetical protein